MSDKQLQNVSPSDLESNKSEAQGQSQAQGKGRTNNLPPHVVDYLKAWIMSPEHINHPYPTETEKLKMMADTGIELKRLNNWFVNNRIRYWKPRIEALQRQQQGLQQLQKQQEQQRLQHLQNQVLPLLQNTKFVVIETQPELRTSAGFNVFASSLIDSHGTSDATVARCPMENFHGIAKPAAGVMAVSPPISPNFTSLSNESSASGTVVSIASTCEDEDETDYVETEKRSATTAESIPRLSRSTEECNKHGLSQKRKGIPEVSPTKYNDQNGGLWNEVCQKAPKKRKQDDLPTLDEAALLFGFARS